MEDRPRKDIKERQRLGEYEDVLAEYATRYAETLRLVTDTWLLTFSRKCLRLLSGL